MSRLSPKDAMRQALRHLALAALAACDPPIGGDAFGGENDGFEPPSGAGLWATETLRPGPEGVAAEGYAPVAAWSVFYQLTLQAPVLEGADRLDRAGDVVAAAFAPGRVSEVRDEAGALLALVEGDGADVSPILPSTRANGEPTGWAGCAVRIGLRVRMVTQRRATDPPFVAAVVTTAT